MRERSGTIEEIARLLAEAVEERARELLASYLTDARPVPAAVSPSTEPRELDALPDLVSVAEYARWARRGRNQAYSDIRTGRVPSVQLGARLLIPKRALHALLDGEPAPTPPPVSLLRKAL